MICNISMITMRLALLRELPTVHTRCVALRQDDDRDNSEYYQQREDNSEHDQFKPRQRGRAWVSGWNTMSVNKVDVGKITHQSHSVQNVFSCLFVSDTGAVVVLLLFTCLFYLFEWLGPIGT